MFVLKLSGIQNYYYYTTIVNKSCYKSIFCRLMSKKIVIKMRSYKKLIGQDLLHLALLITMLKVSKYKFNHLALLITMLKVSKYKLLHLALLITMLKVSKYKFIHLPLLISMLNVNKYKFIHLALLITMLKVSKYKIIHLALLFTILKVSKYKFLHFAMFVITLSRFVDIGCSIDLDKYFGSLLMLKVVNRKYLHLTLLIDP